MEIDKLVVLINEITQQEQTIEHYIHKNLIYDFGMDSLQLAELIVLIEECFNISFDNHSLTIDDISDVDYLLNYVLHKEYGSNE